MTVQPWIRIRRALELAAVAPEMRSASARRAVRRRMLAAMLATALLVAGVGVIAPRGWAAATGTGPVQAYRPVPGAAQSADYDVSVDGSPAYVTAYKDVAYASFGFAKSASVTVTRAGGTLAGMSLLPEGAATVTASTTQTVTFTMDRAADLVLSVPDGPRLFLFADSLSANPAAPSGNDVRSVTDLGVQPDGGLQTAAIQHAIDTVASQGGGIVYFPPGRYLTGTLDMRSHTTLYLADGALIQGTADPADYPVDPGRTETGTNGQTMTFSRLIYFDGVRDAGIAGRGTIDGDGKALRQAGRNANLIRVANSSDVQLSDVVLRDSAAWNTHVLHSSNVSVDNVRIINDVTNPNTDGVDVDGSVNITVNRVFAYVGDDALVVKASNNSGLLQDPHDITFSNCVLLTNKTAMKLGTESLAGSFYNIDFTGNSVVSADRAVGMVSSDGARYADIHYTADTVYSTAHLVEESIDPRSGSSTAGQIDGVLFDQLRVLGYHPTSNTTTNNKSGFVFVGRDDNHQVSDLAFKNVTVNGHQISDYASAARYARLNFGPYVAPVQFQVSGPAATPTELTLQPVDAVKGGQPVTVTAHFTDNAASGQPIQDLRLSLTAPADWQLDPAGAIAFDTVQPGQQVQASWTLTPPADFFGAATIYPRASYVDPSGQRPTSIEGDGTTVAVQSGLVQNITPAYLADPRLAEPGAEFLIDRSSTITGLPSALAGGVLIPGANADKAATQPADYLSFDVAHDATIYVAFDLRGEGSWWPSWLAEDGFTLTGLQIQTSDHPYAVFEKDVPAGHVVLGPNLDAPASNLNTYFTIARPR